MFTTYYKLFHFANNLIFLSPTQETHPLQDFLGNIFKIAAEALSISKLFEGITKVVSSTSSNAQSNVAY